MKLLKKKKYEYFESFPCVGFRNRNASKINGHFGPIFNISDDDTP